MMTPASLPRELADVLEHGTDAVVAAHLAPLIATTEGADVRFLPAGEESIREGHVAPVAARGVAYGGLVSTTLPVESLAAWAASLGEWLALEARMRELKRLAYEDPLTGAGNRRDFDRFLASAMEFARLRDRGLPLMVFDIDDFKRYNDRFGHAAGDEVLRETVALLRAVIRKGDRVFRIGGDEFVVVFADPTSPRTEHSAPLESVEQIATRFTDRIRDLKLPQLGDAGLGAISISAGVAQYPRDGSDPATLLRTADLRALSGKRRGKDIITLGPAHEDDDDGGGDGATEAP